MKKIFKNKKLMLALAGAAVLFLVMKNRASAALPGAGAPGTPGKKVDASKRPSVNVFSKGSKGNAFTGE